METFAEWFGGNRLALLKFATALCVDRGTAQEVVQEVAFKAHLRWARIQVLEQPDAYLRRMVVNEYLSWRRKWARIVPASDLVDDRPEDGPDPMTGADDRHQLRAELTKLSPRQRAVVVLRFYQGLDDAEIAAVLGCPRGTVRSLQSRALRRLRVELADGDQPATPGTPTPRTPGPRPLARADQQES